MFSYYGSKSKIAHKYPKPTHSLIIEPFCGAAHYSMLYHDRDVWLNDLHEPVFELWSWLIHDATESDILKLPTFQPKQRIDMPPGPERTLVAFQSNGGTETPRNVAGAFQSWAKGGRERLAAKVKLIKHWKITKLDYRDLPNVEATWFIDPPYQHGGHEYTVGGKDFDYNACREFCVSRNGQVIVCENTKADWMDFKPLTDIQGQRFRTTEAVWVKP
jgi:site-specific DNA-adenine methylase